MTVAIIIFLGVVVIGSVSSAGSSCAPASGTSGVSALGAPLPLASVGIGGLGVWVIERRGKRNGPRDRN